MPLVQGCSRSSFNENFEKLMDEGYSQNQAFAIAARVAQKNMKKCGVERQREIRNGEFT